MSSFPTFTLALLTFMAIESIARADDRIDRDRVRTTASDPAPAVERPWLYTDDPTIPAPLHVVASLADTYSGNDRSVSRAFASADDGPGAKLAASAQIGLARALALDVTGVVGVWGASETAPTSVHGGTGTGAMVGLKLAPIAASSRFQLAVAAGYMMDLDEASGVYARVMASYDFGALRLAAMVHGEHVFRDGADGVDLFATVGVSRRIVRTFRVGVEYVVQDIEEMWASGGSDGLVVPGRAEGGVHQFVGVTGSFELLQRRLFVNFGPALAFRPETGQVAPVGRINASFSF